MTSMRIMLGVFTMFGFALSYTQATPIVSTGYRVETLAVVNEPFGPVAMALTPDGRLFYTEKQSGKVRVIENGVLLPDPFIDLDVNNYNLRGLFGITLHPDFANNGYVYLSYTKSNTGSDSSDVSEALDNRVIRVKANGNVAEPGSEALIVNVTTPNPLGAHNVGQLTFGPDGKLYVPVSDLNRASHGLRLDTLAGKILRLNDDGSIPADNPFANDGDPDTLAEIFAFGFRNSFDLTFHPTTGMLFATENGPHQGDEVDIIVAGGDYGWGAVRGLANTAAELDYAATHPAYQDPILDITPTVGITGITFFAEDGFFYGATDSFVKKVMLGGPDLDQVLSVEEFFTTGIRSGIRDLVFADDILYIVTGGSVLALHPVPEPSTISLFFIAALGLITVLIFQRRTRYTRVGNRTQCLYKG